MSVAVVNSGGANIASVLHALRRLGVEPVFTADPAIIQQADRVILPGVGAAGQAMATLREHGLTEVICALKQPVLGICLGMQLLFESSAEDNTQLLGIIPARIHKLKHSKDIRIPHMGWNSINCINADPISEPLSGQWFYFVHSYAAPVGKWTLAETVHGQSFSAFVKQNNFYGAQFHPERSATAGATLLKNFMEVACK